MYIYTECETCKGAGLDLMGDCKACNGRGDVPDQNINKYTSSSSTKEESPDYPIYILVALLVAFLILVY